ncbi:MAG TPA: hypothetical protein VNM67_03425 [Thermoanaerobaculia bacterium]|nr:hypothetical protein [Thermoanaerobaculia bacterium]
MKDEVFDAVSAEILAENRALGAGGANREARKVVNDRWGTREGRLGTISGKQAFSVLSEWSQVQFGVSLSPLIIAHEMHASETDAEMAGVIATVGQSEDF